MCRRSIWLPAAGVVALGVMVWGSNFLLTARAARQQSAIPSVALPALPEPPADLDLIATLHDLEQVRELEARCIKVVSQMQPAIIGVMPPSKAALPRTYPHSRGACGVFISADGLILSQWHVSHMRVRSQDASDTHVAGELTTVILSDGQEAQAKLLGADADFDISLLQMVEPGPYPFVPLLADSRVQVGDWVVKLGHPLGFRKDRPAPPRLGRVLAASGQAFVTDCPIIGGDSGGPFFDLDGRLVGIVHGADADVNNHFTKSDPQRDVTDLINMAITSPRIATLLDSMKAGTIKRPGTRIFTREIRRRTVLPASEWTQALAGREFLASRTKYLGDSSLPIMNGDQQVALATIVDSDGWAVTKATHLPPNPQCRLPAGTTREVTVVGVDVAFDVAVIRVSDCEAKPVKWSSGTPLAGAITIAVGRAGQNLILGAVSVAPRAIHSDKEFPYDVPLRVRPNVPEFLVTPSKDGAFEVRSAWGLSKAAGIQPGDRVTSIAGTPLSSPDDVANAVSKLLSGDRVEVEMIRDGKPLTIRLPLWPHVELMEQSFRSDDFPIAMEYSPPVRNVECGGPLVNLDGEVIGISIGRTAHHAGWAIPAAEIQRIVAEIKAGTLGSPAVP